MNNQETNNSNLPLLIIGLVLVVAILGGWWLYSSSKAKPATTKTNTNTNNAEKLAADTKAALEFYAKAPVGAQPPNTLGSPNALVTIEEFADYQCPTCAMVHTRMKEINSLYSGRIKFVFRSFPLTQIHKNAYDAALAAEAAGAQDKYWAMQDQLFSNQQIWSTSDEARKLFEGYAVKIGLNAEKFKNDMAGMLAKNRIEDDIRRGRALGISGTPTVYINGNKLAFEQMDVNSMRQIIDAELQKTSVQTPPNQPAANSANQTANASNVSNATTNNSTNK